MKKMNKISQVPPFIEELTPKQVKEVSDYFGELLPYIFQNQAFFPPYYYNRGLVQLDIWGIDLDSLQICRVRENVVSMHQRLDKYLENKEFEKIFSLLDSRYLIKTYIDHYTEIPNEDKYDLFTSVYIRSEYNFEPLLDLMPKIVSRRFDSLERKQRINKLKNLITNGFVNIYRGADSKSTSIDKAWSWTLSYDIAYYFATRFSDKGILFSSKVRIDDIIDYFASREEEEVLVDPAVILEYQKHIVP